jgi:HAD superfamily hydrolase (TIGR01509 family)
METVLLWDVMGTLVHDPFFVEMPRFFGMTFDAMLAAKDPRAWIEFELDERSEASFLSSFFADRRRFDHRAFVDTVRASYRWLPGMEELLGELHGLDVPMHAFSNYPHWYELIEERLTVSRFVPWSFVSCRTGVRKPDPAAYARVLRELAVSPQRCLFVDDRESNCEAARQSGMQAIRFESAEALRAALSELGIV